AAVVRLQPDQLTDHLGRRGRRVDPGPAEEVLDGRGTPGPPEVLEPVVQLLGPEDLVHRVPDRGGVVGVVAHASALRSQTARMAASFRSTVGTDRPSLTAISAFVNPSIFHIATCRSSPSPSSPSSRPHSSATWAANPGSGSPPAAPASTSGSDS